MLFAAMSGARCQGGDYDHPIVFIVDGDPIALGLVVCLNRPGGSITAYRGSGERPTATTPPTSAMNSRRFISNPAPDVLNPKVSNFSAQVQVVDVREWDGPAVLPPRTAQRMTGGLEARGAHRYVP
jgi:hypothetical protein